MASDQLQLPPEYTPYIPELPPEVRQVVVLYYGLEGNPALSIEEIAEIQRNPDVSTTTTRGRLALGIGLLRKAYQRARRA